MENPLMYLNRSQKASETMQLVAAVNKTYIKTL